MANFLTADDDALRGVTLALKHIDRDSKKEIAAATRNYLRPYWQRAVETRKTLPQDKIFGRANIRWSMGGKGTATVTVRPLSGDKKGKRSGHGLGEGKWKQQPDREWALIDFGGKADQLPRRTPSGRVVYGAVPGLGSLAGKTWLRAVADTIRDATNGD